MDICSKLWFWHGTARGTCLVDDFGVQGVLTRPRNDSHAASWMHFLTSSSARKLWAPFSSDISLANLQQSHAEARHEARVRHRQGDHQEGKSLCPCQCVWKFMP